MYSNIRSRAGLVALVFALTTISLVSAVPIHIPAPQLGLSTPLSSLSNPSRYGQDNLQHGTRRIEKLSLNGQMIRAPAVTGAPVGKHNSIVKDDDQLVRRNIFSKIKKAFQNLGHKIKSGFQKAGQKIKAGFQKVGQKIKQGFQTAGRKIKQGFQKAGQKIKQGFQTAGRKIKQGFQTAGRKIKQGFQTAGRKIKAGFQKVGNGIKHVAQKIGAGIKTAAKKVGHFIKTTGAKIVKFGLKVVQSVGTVVGKVAAFIPAIGKGVQQAINGVSKVAGVISDKIHVKLSPKLQKGMDVMNKADKYMGYIPRRRDLSDEEDFQQWDISSDTYFDDDYEHWE